MQAPHGAPRPVAAPRFETPACSGLLSVRTA